MNNCKLTRSTPRVNRSPESDHTQFYRFYSTLTGEQLDMLLERFRHDCEIYQYDCAQSVVRIKLFKAMNPSYKHIYKEMW